MRKGKKERGRERDRETERLGYQSVKKNGEIPRERWISEVGHIRRG